MAQNKRFACGECHMVLPESVDQCVHCPSSPVTLDWSGYVLIMDYNRSEVAQRLKIERNGEFALKVSVR
ncbi:MAG: DNA-directed RNA polymerase subunit E'' [Methanobacteriota archaeon]|nr:MAG: DNA-directed RNA polymerase subunit E'' [Euryarchaeota archaeon]|tara:strand:+ start:8794 stop:9000 length:207 start_codon:yes stop_codon:yes gene_type:complete